MPAEPSINDLSPIAPKGTLLEPVALIDTTGSMSWPVSATSSLERRDVLGEAMGALVEALAAKDAQAEAEKAAGDDDKGGLLTFTFAGGGAKELGDLDADNWRAKWKSIQWGGGTVIMPGWTEVVSAFVEEFHDTPADEKPSLLALVITDGEADDTDAFARVLANKQDDTYVCVAIMGYGPEHDRALHVYQNIALQNDHVRVVTFGSETDPNVISSGLLSLVGE